MRERDIFITALERKNAADQRAYVSEACGDDAALCERVVKLLDQHDRPGTFVLDRVAAVDTVEEAPGCEPGQHIGRYKLIEKLGEGGFGEVWMGEQELPVRRTVAIKIIKLGMDTKQVIARFESERQALALMNHPNIATVLDVGATETGRPFFVMELVRGVPITDYCDAEALDTRRRLELLASVCSAVQHAHQRGIIHRDLKPSNILVAVDDGIATPKVIDFGIAKATNAEHTEQTFFTENQQVIGTPAYMSPEQAEMGNRDIDTRCDVYSLGVLLYELLTGATPFDSSALRDAGYGEMLRIIREDEPKKPSTRMSTLGASADMTAKRRSTDVRKLGKLFRGDLDWIVMRCLEKDRTRRYASAKDLSDEIQRHLRDEPVSAGPPSVGYRMQKFIRRNRGAVISAALVMLTLAAGVVGTSVGLIRALDEKRKAEQARQIAVVRADESEQLVEFHSSLLREINLAELGDRIAETYIEKFAESYRRNTEGAGEAGAEAGRGAKESVRTFEKNLAMVNGADIATIVIADYILEPAAAAASKQFVGQPLLEASIRHAIGENYAAIGLFEQAEAHARWALETRQGELPPNSVEIAESAYLVAGTLFQSGMHEQAVALLRLANACDFSLSRDAGELKAIIVTSLGSVATRRGNYDEAERLLHEGLKLVLEDSPHAANILSVLATTSYKRGDFAKAEALLRQAIESRTDPSYSADDLRDLSSLGALQGRLGKNKEAEVTLREILKRTREELGTTHPSVANPAINLAELLMGMGNFTESETLHEEAIAIIHSTQGEIHPSAAKAIKNLGVLYGKTGRYAEAEAKFREAIAIIEQLYGGEHPDLAVPRISLATSLVKQQRFAEAEEQLRLVLNDENQSTKMDELRRVAGLKLLDLYQAWHEADPHGGYDVRAQELNNRAAAGATITEQSDD